MLSSITQYLYVFLLIIFGIFVFIMNYFDTITINNNFLYFYTLLLIPVFDYFIGDYCKNNIFTKYAVSGLNLLKYFVLVFGGIILFILGWELLNIALVLFLIGSLFFDIDSRISFICALILFVYIPVLMMMDQAKMAESLSIYAYYFLIIGVFVQIIQPLKNTLLK